MEPYKTSLLTMEEKEEMTKFSHLVDNITAEREAFISEAQKRLWQQKIMTLHHLILNQRNTMKLRQKSRK